MEQALMSPRRTQIPAEDLAIFEWEGGLFGLQDKRDDYYYNERFHTRKEAEEWIAAGGQPTELTQDFDNESDALFRNGKFVCYFGDLTSFNLSCAELAILNAALAQLPVNARESIAHYVDVMSSSA